MTPISTVCVHPNMYRVLAALAFSNVEHFLSKSNLSALDRDDDTPREPAVSRDRRYFARFKARRSLYLFCYGNIRISSNNVIRA